MPAIIWFGHRGPRPAPARLVSARALIALIALSSRSLPAAAGTELQDTARAYYLFSMAQQAQFRSQLLEAIRYLEEAIQSADSPDLRLELAELYASMNDSKKAEGQAREALRLDPSSAPARSALAEILFHRAAGDPEPASYLKESESLYQELMDRGQAEESSAQALADLQRGRGDPQAAAATLEHYRATHPFSPGVSVHLARSYQDMGRSEEARKLLEETLAKSRDNREARELLAGILENAGEAEKAVEVYRPVAVGATGNLYAQYRLGALLTGAGKFDEAKACFRTALQLDPANVRVLLALGQACLGAGETREAEDHYVAALDREAGSLEARFFLGRIAQSRAEDDRALTLYRQILSQTAEKKSGQDRVFFGLASFQMAVIHYLRRDYATALSGVRDAIASASRPSLELYQLLIRIHLDRGERADAQAALHEASGALPESPGLKALMGEIHLRLGDPAAARRNFREILQKPGSGAPEYLLILQACARAEAIREGETWAREGVEKYPDSEEIAFQRAALLERVGRLRESEAAFRALIERHPGNAEALNYLGYMLADRGSKVEEALGFIQRAVALQPENAAFLDSLGWAYFRLGRTEEAERTLARAVQGSRDDPTILEHLGDAKTKLGKPAEALEVYRRALDREPEKPETLRKKIRKLGISPAGR